MKNMSRQLLFRVKDKSCLGAQHDSMSSALCHQCHHHITLCVCVRVCMYYLHCGDYDLFMHLLCGDPYNESPHNDDHKMLLGRLLTSNSKL